MERLIQIPTSLFHHSFLIRVFWLLNKGKTHFVSNVLDWSHEKTKIGVVNDKISAPSSTVDQENASPDLVAPQSFWLYHITNPGMCSGYGWARDILNAAGRTGRLPNDTSRELTTPAQRPAYPVLDKYGAYKTHRYSLPSGRMLHPTTCGTGVIA